MQTFIYTEITGGFPTTAVYNTERFEKNLLNIGLFLFGHFGKGAWEMYL